MPPTTKKVRVMNEELPTKRKLRPALTPEAEENQMISLAMDIAKQRLLDGTASSQILIHFLQLGTTKQQQDAEIKELEKELLIAKTESLRSQKKMEELYTEAIKAMGIYNGSVPAPEGDSDE